MHFVDVERPRLALRRPVDRATIEALLRAALGADARLSGAVPVGRGHFNTTYRIDLSDGARVALRLGPPAEAPLWRHEQALLRREAAVQPSLAVLGALVPRWLHADFSRHLVARDWAILEWREAEPWEAVLPALDSAGADALWQDYGACARRLHAIGGDRFGYPAPMPAHARYGDWFLALIDGMADDLREQRIAVEGLEAFRERLRRERARLDAVAPPRLVHGDLWPRNLLVARDRGNRSDPGGRWRVAALLDAERAFWGEPAAEWIFGFLDLPEAFWRGYGERLDDAALRGDALWRRRAAQARGALQMMLEGRRFGFDAAFAHAQFARFAGALERISTPAPAPAPAPATAAALP